MTRGLSESCQELRRDPFWLSLYGGKGTFVGKDSDPNVIGVSWNALMALRFRAKNGREGSISPALALLHELEHARGIMTGESQQSTWNPINWVMAFTDWHNLEEQRVILGIERSAATTLGEGIRDAHTGIPYYTTGPTSREYISNYPGYEWAPKQTPADVIR